MGNRLKVEQLRGRLTQLVENGLTGMDLTVCWYIRRAQPLQDHDIEICRWPGGGDLECDDLNGLHACTASA